MTEAVAKRSLEKEHPDLTIWNVREFPDCYIFTATENGKDPRLDMDPFYKVSKDDGDVTNYTPMMEDDPETFFNADVKVYKEFSYSPNKKESEDEKIIHGIKMDVKMSDLFSEGMGLF